MTARTNPRVSPSQSLGHELTSDLPPGTGHSRYLAYDAFEECQP